MDINPYHLLYIIREQQLEYCDINISHIICQYAKLNIWEQEYEADYEPYDNGYHLCIKRKQTLYPYDPCDTRDYQCEYGSWQEFIDEKQYLEDYTMRIFDWEWFTYYRSTTYVFGNDQYIERDLLQLMFMIAGNRPTVFFAHIHASRNDEEDIRKFINKYSTSCNITL